MKWAVFEFEDLSCEVGETDWIYGEDETLFNNDDWFFSNEVVVKWPKDFKKWKRISARSLVDTDELETERHSAKIIKFSGKSYNIKYIRHTVRHFGQQCSWA